MNFPLCPDSLSFRVNFHQGQSEKLSAMRRASLSKKVKPSSTKGIALRSMPRLYAGGVQFDTSLREMCFLRRTRRRRKRLNLFFRCGEKTLRGFFDSLTLRHAESFYFTRIYKVLL